MKIESYKGIEFVRISQMPEQQQAQIHQSLDKSKIIKILRDKELLNDCIQAADYNEWLGATRKAVQESPAVSAAIGELRLSFE
jgi:hypothetical protein